MTSPEEQAKLASKLMDPVGRIVSRHTAELAPMLNNGAAVTQAALSNDEAVRTVATHCYALLPGLVRLAVKEPCLHCLRAGEPRQTPWQTC